MKAMARSRRGYSKASAKSRNPAALHQTMPPDHMPKLVTNQSMAEGMRTSVTRRSRMARKRKAQCGCCRMLALPTKERRKPRLSTRLATMVRPSRPA